MTVLPLLPKIIPRQRLWTVKEYHQMAYPAVFGLEEHLELIEGGIYFRGTDIRRPFTLADYRRLRKMGLIRPGDALDLVDGKGVPYMSPMGRPQAVAVIKTEETLRNVFGLGYVV